jgi:hypothetical protein
MYLPDFLTKNVSDLLIPDEARSKYASHIKKTKNIAFFATGGTITS